MNTKLIPNWWVRLSDRQRIAFLSLTVPGLVLHEMLHKWAAHGIGNATVDWLFIGVDFKFDFDAPIERKIAAYLAPTLIGVPISLVLILVAIWANISIILPAAIIILINLMLLCAPSKADLRGAAGEYLIFRMSNLDLTDFLK